MKNIILCAVFSFATLAFSAEDKLLEADVKLFPAGSFIVKTDKIKGKLVQAKDGTLKADGIKILVKNLDSGLELRDEHMRKRLGIEKDDKVSLILKSLTAKDGKGTATFIVNEKEQTTDINYQSIGGDVAEANFKLDLEKFDIKGISYLGVGVEKDVQVKVKLPITKE